uniref:Uncharacterized protein n=1 Tax=Solanum lycopersicum TaxID=4081 RepID=K4CTM4_SOLLC
MEDALTSGNIEADHMLEELRNKFTNVLDSLALLTRSNEDIATLEGLGTPRIGTAKSLESWLSTIISKKVTTIFSPYGAPDGASPVGIQPQATLHNGASSSMGFTTGKQTFATAVTMANQTSKIVRHPRESVIAKITSHNGIPTVIFNATDYYRIMADECSPFHMHTWHYIKQIVSSVGFRYDGATNCRTRPSMAEVRVEVDLLKPQPNTVWVGFEDDKCPLRGFNQKLEYKNIPKYCKHYRKMGHNVMNCWILEKIKSNDKKGSVLKENQADVNLENSEKGTSKFEIVQEAPQKI